jgi:glycopeptide antibiotics resistance protein
LNPFKAIAVADWIINLIGFVPLGLLLTALGQRASVACIWCAVLSLSIEAGQFFTMTRDSSGSDLFLNTLGGAIGAWSGHWVGVRSKPVETRSATD